MFARALILAAGLAVASTSQAVMLIDFGNSEGYGGSKLYTIGEGANGWTNFWGTPSAQSYSADSVTIDWTITGTWQNGASQFGGWGGSFTDRMTPWTGVNSTDTIAIEGRLVSAPEGMTFFKLQLLFQAVDGSESEFQIYPDVWPWSNTKFTNEMQVVPVLTDIANPSWVHPDHGAFDFATDKLDQLQIMFQSADPAPAGNVVFEFANIQTVPIPEPSMMGVLAGAGLLLARRKR